jgi:hypothetical protein
MSENLSRKHLLGFAASFGLFTSLGTQGARASGGVIGAWRLVSFNVDEGQHTIAGDILTIRTLPPEIWGSSNVLVWKRA